MKKNVFNGITMVTIRFYNGRTKTDVSLRKTRYHTARKVICGWNRSFILFNTFPENTSDNVRNITFS